MDRMGDAPAPALTRYLRDRAMRKVTLLLATMALAVMLASPPAWADTTFMVDTTVDDASATACAAASDNDCSLRGAVIAANTTPGADAVEVPEGTYTLTIGGGYEDDSATGDLDIKEALTINGAGADSTTVAGGKGFDDRIFQNLGGEYAEDGTWITYPSNTTITGLTITGASGSGCGGGICNWRGTLKVSDSTITGNTASYLGGGIDNSGGTLTVERSTISGNTSDNTGGGIHSQTFDPTTQKPIIVNSTISGNTAGEYGGGLYNYAGIIEIEHSTITNNSAPTNQGSGVASSGVYDTTHTDVFSSILSANANTDVDFVRGADTSFFVSKGYNLIGDGNATDAFNQSGDRKGADDPGLAPLMLNAPGSTQTHALKATSPALDAGPPSTTQCPPPATDQRGVSRPQQGGCDIGAFEFMDTKKPRVSAATPTGTGIGRGTNLAATFSGKCAPPRSPTPPSSSSRSPPAGRPRLPM